jgi:hypothetical protein
MSGTNAGELLSENVQEIVHIGNECIYGMVILKRTIDITYRSCEYNVMECLRIGL